MNLDLVSKIICVCDKLKQEIIYSNKNGQNFIDLFRNRVFMIEMAKTVLAAS